MLLLAVREHYQITIRERDKLIKYLRSIWHGSKKPRGWYAASIPSDSRHRLGSRRRLRDRRAWPQQGLTMSVNDPDGEPYEELTKEEFVDLLVRTGWSKDSAESEWEYFDKPVRICDLEW
jgi:hypothetical protein